MTADPARTTWLRRFATPGEPGEPGARLVCFPHAGGSASFFVPLAGRFAAATDVVAVQYPGRQDRHREPPLTSIAGLADAVSAELAGAAPLPTVYFGHSMGALVAFEVARRLERDRPAAAPSSLVVSGRRAPGTRRDESVHEYDDAGLLAEVRRLNGPDMSGFDEEMLALVLPALRADYVAVESYPVDPDVRVDAAVTALTGRDDPRTSVEEADAWRDHTRGRFRLEVFDGDHFFLVGHAGAVGDRLAEELAASAGAAVG